MRHLQQHAACRSPTRASCGVRADPAAWLCLAQGPVDMQRGCAGSTWRVPGAIVLLICRLFASDCMGCTLASRSSPDYCCRHCHLLRECQHPCCCLRCAAEVQHHGAVLLMTRHRILPCYWLLPAAVCVKSSQIGSRCRQRSSHRVTHLTYSSSHLASCCRPQVRSKASSACV